MKLRPRTKRPVRGRLGMGESGQILPWAVFAIAAGALLALFIARAGMVLERRTRLQTAVDATALSAGTMYARGLNIVAASNQLLFTAAVADAAVKLSGTGALASLAAHLGSGGKPASFTQMVMVFQDAWAGTAGGGNNPAARSAGVAPVLMESFTLLTGARNGLSPVVLWNGCDGPEGLAPDLNLRRANVSDLALWLAGGEKSVTTGNGRTAVTSTSARERKVYSYQPEGGGPRVFLSEDEVEHITFINRNRVVTAAREKARNGAEAGRFVKPGSILEKISKTFDLPMPLIERGPVHGVLVIARPLEVVGPGWSRFPLQASALVAGRAEVHGGAVFNAAYGDPSFSVRLTAVGNGSHQVERLLEHLADPAAWGAWVVQTARTAAIAMVQNAAVNAIRSRLPIPL